MRQIRNAMNHPKTFGNNSDNIWLSNEIAGNRRSLIVQRSFHFFPKKECIKNKSIQHSNKYGIDDKRCSFICVISPLHNYISNETKVSI